MKFIDCCIFPRANSITLLAVIYISLFIIRIENINALSFRSIQPPQSIISTPTRNDADIPNSLNAASNSNVLAVTDSNYRELFQGEKLLLLDAFAQWCGPCKMIDPVLKQCAEDWKDSVVVGKFDVDDANGKNSKSRDLKIELILQGVMPTALPALILVHKNKVLDTWKGVISSAELQDLLEKHVVEDKHHVGSKHTFEHNLSKKEGMVCENGVCRMPDKATNNLDHNKVPAFRGIGLVYNL